MLELWHDGKRTASRALKPREEGEMPTELTVIFPVRIVKAEDNTYGESFDVFLDDSHHLGCVNEVRYIDSNERIGYRYGNQIYKTLAPAVWAMLADCSKGLHRKLR